MHFDAHYMSLMFGELGHFFLAIHSHFVGFDFGG
jgi:hypothetical protein